MRFTQVAARYAKALFELAKEAGEQDRVFSELRQISTLLEREQQITEFLLSPVVKSEEKVISLSKAIAHDSISEVTRNFILLLAKKNRLALFAEITHAFQTHSDAAHGVVRGQVRSATVLAPEQRTQLEGIVGKVTKKQAILSYKEEPTIIGGLIAEVGTYTFDDTLSSHLRRVKEELNRRAN